MNSTLDIIPTAFFAFSEEEDEPRSYKRLIYPFINRGCDIVAQHPTFLLFRCRIETKMGKCLGGYYLARITQFYEIVTKVISATQCELMWSLYVYSNRCHKVKFPPPPPPQHSLIGVPLLMLYSTKYTVSLALASPSFEEGLEPITCFQGSSHRCSPAGWVKITRVMQGKASK